MLALPPPGSPARLSSLFSVHVFHGWSDCQVPLKGSMAASSGNGVEEEEEKHASVRFVAVSPLRFKSVPHEAATDGVFRVHEDGRVQLFVEPQRKCRVRARSRSLAYIDELIDGHGRMVKFWHVADYVAGEIDVTANPAEDEAIAEAGWFARDALPAGHVFPDVLHGRFWTDLAEGFPAPVKLPLKQSIF